jgi:peptide/nickel transport system permease protein
MIGQALHRLGLTILVLLIVAVVAFLLLRLTPGDPAAMMAGEQASPQEIERIREALDLDKPLPTQLMSWLGNLVRGELGVSIFSGIPVIQLIAQRTEPTLSLTLSTLIVTILVGIPLGVLAAWRNGTAVDRLISTLSVAGFATPSFVLAYLFVFLFAVKLRWLPTQGFVPIGEGLVPFLRSIALPTLSLSLAFIAMVVRMTRASVLEVLREDYIRTAFAKGASAKRVLFYHALRAAAVPIATVIGLGIAVLIGGVVVIESVYNVPGVGRLVVDAVLRRDYPVVQGCMVVFALVYVIINLVIDIAYIALDPRIRL